MMVFPFTVPLDGSGRMLDAAQGVYGRSLARTLAEVEGYLAWLRGRDMRGAQERGVRVPDPRRSFEPYLEAMRRDPRFTDAQERLLALALDFALGGQGPLTAAREACEKLLAIDASAFKAHLALAEIDLAQGDAVAAEGRIAAPLKLQSQWAPAFERMGTALVRQKRHAEAIGWFEKAIRERPEDTDALQGLGVALAECGPLEDAVRNWQAALSHGVHTADLHDNLANSLSLLGRRAEARAHRALSRRLQGKGRFGLDLVREAWEWL